jgi:hypothetical protein
MSYKLTLVGALFAGAVIIGSPGALATIITLDVAHTARFDGQTIVTFPQGPIIGSPFTQDITSVFDNGFGPALLEIEGPGQGYANWVALGLPQFNAGSAANLFTLSSGGINTILITQHQPRSPSFPPFNFSSIGLANGTNDGTGGDVVFLFDHTDGTLDTVLVSLQPGRIGLQTFTFNEQNLFSVSFFPVTTENLLLQFNDLYRVPLIRTRAPIGAIR